MPRSREIVVVKLISSDFTSEFSMVSGVAEPEHKFSVSLNAENWNCCQQNVSALATKISPILDEGGIPCIA